MKLFITEKVLKNNSTEEKRPNHHGEMNPGFRLQSLWLQILSGTCETFFSYCHSVLARRSLRPLLELEFTLVAKDTFQKMDSGNLWVKHSLFPPPTIVSVFILDISLPTANPSPRDWNLREWLSLDLCLVLTSELLSM